MLISSRHFKKFVSVEGWYQRGLITHQSKQTNLTCLSASWISKARPQRNNKDLCFQKEKSCWGNEHMKKGRIKPVNWEYWRGFFVLDYGKTQTTSWRTEVSIARPRPKSRILGRKSTGIIDTIFLCEHCAMSSSPSFSPAQLVPCAGEHVSFISHWYSNTV